MLKYGENPPSKLHARWQGPFRVLSFEGDAYTIQNLVTLTVYTRNIHELAPFKWDATVVDPVNVAAMDDQEFFVERILAHEGNLNKVSSLRFKVRWTGYGAEDDTWEPWKNLRDTDQLHAYLRSINQERLIPKKFLKKIPNLVLNKLRINNFIDLFFNF